MLIKSAETKKITVVKPSNPRFIVKVFDKYLQHIQREGRFYRKPLGDKGSDKSIRFSVQSIEINTLIHALSSSVAQFSLLSLSFLFTEVAVLSVSHAVIVGFGGCSA
jgi:hypothetical protein